MAWTDSRSGRRRRRMMIRNAARCPCRDALGTQVMKRISRYAALSNETLAARRRDRIPEQVHPKERSFVA